MEKYNFKSGPTEWLAVTIEEAIAKGCPNNIINTELLKQKKTTQRAAINTIRDERINTGIEYPADSGNFYDSDSEAKANITGAVVMYSAAKDLGQGDDFKQPWIKMDGKTELLTGPDLVTLGMILGAHVGLHRVQAAEYKDQLEQAETTEEVDMLVADYKALN